MLVSFVSNCVFWFVDIVQLLVASQLVYSDDGSATSIFLFCCGHDGRVGCAVLFSWSFGLQARTDEQTVEQIFSFRDSVRQKTILGFLFLSLQLASTQQSSLAVQQATLGCPRGSGEYLQSHRTKPEKMRQFHSSFDAFLFGKQVDNIQLHISLLGDYKQPGGQHLRGRMETMKMDTYMMLSTKMGPRRQKYRHVSQFQKVHLS